ncbi:hypothetical protein [Lentibacillus amyloliquefaciens]|uniref:Uncharacterized protein n=1 Tax=Lentibacillus amyloliquefaciens TaxID=1472767 RepID=A0A0U4E3R6_9BACI|nr:hypothetical protein [Lentibacillus amyloliquefaciens]ALX47553.1 hypothetical protein AOX59_02390 [Lentibacillus amyloliquefaciens]
MKNKLNRGRENKVYISLLLIAGLAFGVFFTSKTWMYDDSVIAQTAFNESIGGLSQTTLTLRDWEYNPNNELMEVTLERNHTGTDAVEPTFSFYAKEQNESQKYNAELVYQSDNNMVVQIENVPESFQVIGLFVTEHRDQNILKQAYKKQLENKGGETTVTDQDIKESDLPEPEEVIIVGDYRKIDINQSLVTKTDKGYKKENIIADMERTKQEITTIIEEDIPFQEDLITTLKEEKQSLKQDMAFETNEEQADTEREIEQKDKAIEDAKGEIEKLKKKVKDLRDKYQNREEKLNTLTQNKNDNKQQENDKVDADNAKSNQQDANKNKQDKNNSSSNKSSNDKEKSNEKNDY